LVFFLYIAESPEAQRLYRTPELLWFIGPLILYWISRLWLLVRRNEVDADPVSFALRDPVTWIISLLVVGFAAAAALF